MTGEEINKAAEFYLKEKENSADITEIFNQWVDTVKAKPDFEEAKQILKIFEALSSSDPTILKNFKKIY